jgi:hypothetical protein
MKIRTYSELLSFFSFEDRFNYLKLSGRVGEQTFGFDRHINQTLYHSREWKSVRNHVIIRDMGCDLGVSGYEIHDGILVHHMNPLTVDDILNSDEIAFDPEFLISTTNRTHNAIHYGDGNQIISKFVDRKPGDTKLW